MLSSWRLSNPGGPHATLLFFGVIKASRSGRSAGDGMSYK